MGFTNQQVEQAFDYALENKVDFLDVLLKFQ
jgi:hypothetical protein